MTRKLNLGIVGLSEGNGHPYSWSAIINGYEASVMEQCPFPAIPAYLAQRRFPEDQLQDAEVTHIWTQDPELSAHIARASRISTVVADPQEMLGGIDALLLARDDAENHRRLAAPFLRAGIPVYVDKPPALSLLELDQLFALAVEPTQIFSCSALRFAEELRLTSEEAERLGPVRDISGITPKSWECYSAHLVDPIVSFLQPGEIRQSHSTIEGKSVKLSVRWDDGRTGLIQATGSSGGEIALTYTGERAAIKKVFRDSFLAFRSALQLFLVGVRKGRSEIPYAHLKRVVELIELGRHGSRHSAPGNAAYPA